MPEECPGGCDIPGAIAECLSGECVLVDCLPGRYDDDAFEEGCERAVEPGERLVVGPGEDFETLQAALAEPGPAPGTTLELVDDDHVGPFVVASPFITIVGSRRAVLSSADDGPVITIQADHVRLEGVSVEHAQVGPGVHFSAVVGGVLDGVLVKAPRVGAPPEGGVHGVRVEGSAGVRLTDVIVSGLFASGIVSECGADNGHGVRGVVILDSPDVLVRNLAVLDLQGGPGRTNGSNNCGGPRGTGGHAMGLQAIGSRGLRVAGGRMERLTGGAAGGGATGGPAVGIWLQGMADAHLSDLRMENLIGGAPGANSHEARSLMGRGVGVHLYEDAQENRIDDDVTVEGDAVVYRHPPNCHDVIGHRLLGDGNTTNLGKITVVDCAGTVVSDNHVRGYVGEPGIKGRRERPSANPGGFGAGIRVIGGGDVTVSLNEVWEVSGGPGGAGLASGAGAGGPTAGIRLEDCEACVISGNTVRDVEGGAGNGAFQANHAPG